MTYCHVNRSSNRSYRASLFTFLLISSTYLVSFQRFYKKGRILPDLTVLFILLVAVYDITIAYKHRCPTFMDNVYGVAPSEVHIHVQRILLDSIPTSEEEVTTWLINRFHLKDQMLSDFRSLGQFPKQGTEKELSTAKCLVNIGAVIFLTGIFTYCTFSSFWFSIYASLVCVYLTSATYFNIRPTPIVDLVKALSKSKPS